MTARIKKGEELFVRVETVMTDLQISRPFAYRMGNRMIMYLKI